MRENTREQQKIQLKTVILAIIIGVIVGALDALFGRVLLYVSAVRSEHVIWLVPFLGVAGAISIFAYKRYSEESLKGMGMIIQTGLGKNEKIPILLVPLIMVGTWLTHLFGGSAGREGVAVQLGATISHAIGRKTKMPNNSRVLLITGMAAGFAGLFQTPLTATFFAMEVMIAGVMLYEALLPAFVAALGYAAVFGAATNTLLAPIIVGIEVFGGTNMEAFVIVCIIAYICNGKQSIYGAQRRYTFSL